MSLLVEAYTILHTTHTHTWSNDEGPTTALAIKDDSAIDGIAAASDRL